MSQVYELSFGKNGLGDILQHAHGTDWPVVYMISNDDEMYIGETINLFIRSNQHLENPKRQKLKRLHFVADEHFNKSATLDIESWLIQYVAADGKYRLQNGNGGLRDHSYYDRDRSRAIFEVLWKELQKRKLVKQDLTQIRNSDLFKFSPYKSLTAEQLIVAQQLEEHVSQSRGATTFIVHGRPGTGKTILATYFMKRLRDQEETKHLKIGLVVAMSSLRNTLKKVFKNVDGLSAKMVVGPADVVGKDYDLLVVDEAHRLRQRKNITNYAAHDAKNRALRLDENGTELDWVLLSSKKQILFYDEKQSVRPSDVNAEDFAKLKTKNFVLENQMRVKGGEEYLNMIEDVLEVRPRKVYNIKDYDFKIYDDLGQMVQDIRKKNNDHDLSRLVAGYAWPWKSKKNPKDYDIEIDDVKLRWNSTIDNWVNSPNAINEVGCIHTAQGYEFNYAGVIVGPEMSFDPDKQEFFIKDEYYFDRNGFQGVQNPEELKRYIINIYKTLLTRGIEGTYVYFVDKEVERYMRSYLFLSV